MKKLLLILMVGASLALSACVTLDQAVKDVQTAVRPALIRETLPQICQAAKENRVRANEFYANKAMAATGEVKLISDGYKPRYRVMLQSDKINVHAGTDNQFAVKQLNVGKVASVTGTITDVSFDFQGCSIILKDSTF
jgi:predicted small secreted protein